MLVIPFLIVSLSFIDPFIQVLNINKEDLVNHCSEITSKDEQEYLIYGQTCKVEDIDAIKFLHQPLSFLAYSQDLTKDISSIIMYVKSDSTFSTLLEQRFGPPTSIFSSNATINGKYNSYVSKAWKSNGYAMQVSVAKKLTKKPFKQKEFLYRVWIYKIGNHFGR